MANRMVVLAALCLIPAHPGFVFKDGATLTIREERPYSYTENKNQSGQSSGENLA